MSSLSESKLIQRIQSSLLRLVEAVAAAEFRHTQWPTKAEGEC